MNEKLSRPCARLASDGPRPPLSMLAALRVLGTGLLVALGLSLLAACQSPEQELASMVDSNRRDLLALEGTAGLGKKVHGRVARRVERARELIRRTPPTSPAACMNGARLLVRSDSAVDLALAEELGRLAAAAGLQDALPLVAEAVDRQLLISDRPQRYGTVYVWVPVLKAWRLYDVDPTTTDEDRAAMGVRPFRELVAREQELNGERWQDRIR
ncbi:MAG: hypothetical protein QF724_00930 [Planctomycetota bacterium]|nr:hypothetical protein [Planctomycetota bacterium]MDP6837478.1 hypothetical protein [Planctomycetota bacterium]